MPQDRKALAGIEQTGDRRAEDIWKFFLKCPSNGCCKIKAVGMVDYDGIQL